MNEHIQDLETLRKVEAALPRGTYDSYHGLGRAIGLSATRVQRALTSANPTVTRARVARDLIVHAVGQVGHRR